MSDESQKQEPIIGTYQGIVNEVSALVENDVSSGKIDVSEDNVLSDVKKENNTETNNDTTDKKEKPDKINDDKKEEISTKDEKEPIKEEVVLPKSKRERFRELAEKEFSNRQREESIKKREKEVELELDELKAFKKSFLDDPYKHLEKHIGPHAHEEYTKRIMSESDGKLDHKDREIQALKSQLSEIKEMIIETNKKTSHQATDSFVNNFMSNIDQGLRDSNFDIIREHSEIQEKLTGNKIDYHKTAANIYDEFLQQYNKQLTPMDVLEIMKEDSESYLDKFKSYMKESFGSENEKSEEVVNEKKEEKNLIKTLTNKIETQSESAKENDYSDYNDRRSFIDSIISSVEKM